MTLRQCIACGADITTGSRCTRCKPARQRNGWAWTLLKREHLLRHPGCAICGTTVNVEVHHRIPLRDGGKDERTNLRTLCRPHHLAEHQGGL